MASRKKPVVDEIIEELRPDNMIKEFIPSPEELFGKPLLPHKLIKELF
jgi:hypothetical protein